MMRPLKILILSVLGCFLLAAGAIVFYGLNDQIAVADLIVVPGNAVLRDGTPSPRLRARLDAALQLYQGRHAPLIFLSGGTGKEGYDEAISMSNYLMLKGVPASAIVKDGLGVDTAATAKNAANFMHTKNLKTALVATQHFHVARTKLALERSGIRVTGHAHAQYFEMRDFYSIAREVIAYFSYLVK